MWRTNETRKYMSPNIIVANWLSYAYNGDKKLRWQTNHLFNTKWPEENPRRIINLFSLDFSMYIHKILVYWDYVGSGKKYLIWKIFWASFFSYLFAVDYGSNFILSSYEQF